MWALVKRGWRFLLEVHSVYGLVVDVVGVLGVSGGLTFFAHYLGEHSGALLATIFVVTAGVLFVGSLAVMGQRAPQLPRRKPLLQFVKTAIEQLGINKESLELLTLAQALRQAGSDGAINFFGHALSNGLGTLTREFVARNQLFVEIPREFFNDGRIDVLEFTRGDDNLNTTIYPLSGSKIFINIQVNPEQARIWLKREAKDIMRAIPKHN